MQWPGRRAIRKYHAAARSEAQPSCPMRLTATDVAVAMRHAFRAGDEHAVNAQAIEQIEIKIAFLERANAELSDVVFRQHRDIEALREQIGALASRLQTYESDVTPRTPEEERPPHY